MNLETKSIDMQYLAYLTEHNLKSVQYPMTTYVIAQLEKPKAHLSPEDEMHQFNNRYMRGKRGN